MRYGILFLLATIAGCAHVSHKDPETGLEVTYTGSANGATELVEAVNERPYDLTEQAMDKGMNTTLVRDADGDIRFNAGYGYTYAPSGNVGGYAPANTGYIPGQGFVVGPPVSTLPPLATTVVTTGVLPSIQSGGIAICPTDRAPATSAEQAACALLSAKTALEQSND